MNATALDDFALDLGAGSELAMACALALMMFAVALSLRVENFKAIKSRPKPYAAGVAAQLIGLPLVTLILCFIVQPYASLALGMILIACCPGGNVSNLFALFGRANTALSVSLTATSSLTAAVFTPISILFWSYLYPPTRMLLTEINIDAADFLVQTLIILALPLCAGMALRHFAPKLAGTLQKPLATISACALMAIIVIACIKFAPVFFALGAGIFILVIVHNGLAFLLGYAAAKVSRADTASARALIFEVGIQNSGLGIVILLTQLGGIGGAGAIAGLWGIWHLIAGLSLTALFRWKDKTTPNAKPRYKKRQDPKHNAET